MKQGYFDIIYIKLRTVQFSLICMYIVQCTKFNLHCTLYNVPLPTFCNVHASKYLVYATLCIELIATLCIVVNWNKTKVWQLYKPHILLKFQRKWTLSNNCRSTEYNLYRYKALNTGILTLSWVVNSSFLIVDYIQTMQWISLFVGIK